MADDFSGFSINHVHISVVVYIYEMGNISARMTQHTTRNWHMRLWSTWLAIRLSRDFQHLVNGSNAAANTANQRVYWWIIEHHFSHLTYIKAIILSICRHTRILYIAEQIDCFFIYVDFFRWLAVCFVVEAFRVNCELEVYVQWERRVDLIRTLE